MTSPNLSDLRSVLASVFSAYAYEESILSLANRLLDKDLFVNVQSSTALRQRGWRPRGSTCESCGKRVWGPGVSGGVFAQWEERQDIEDRRKKEKMALRRMEAQGRDKGKAVTGEVSTAPSSSMKGKERALAIDGEDEDSGFDGDVEAGGQELGPLVVLACRHIYHQSCLEAVQGDGAGVNGGGGYRCPIDG